MSLTRSYQAPAGSSRRNGYVGQRILLWMIAFYRKWLSGRGPFRSVRCTFEHTESCSSYGLRVAQNGSALLPVIRLIVRRLQCCERASLYRIDGTLVWERLYDQYDTPAELERYLVQSQELTSTRSAVLQALAWIARFQGNRKVQRQCQPLRRSLPVSQRLILRNALGFRRSLRRKLAVRVTLAMVPLLAALCFTSAWWILVGLAVTSMLVLSTWVAQSRRYRRIEQIIAASQFIVPSTGSANAKRSG